MNGDVTSVLSARSRSATIAFTCIAAWLGAAASTGPLGIWPAIGGIAVALGVVVVWFDRRRAAMLLQPSQRLVLFGFGAGGLMAAATYALYPLLARIVPFIATDTAHLYAAFRAPSLSIAAVALVPVILGEELVWRGVVQTAIVERLGTRQAVVLAAAVYALVHAPLGSPLLVAVAFFCGLAWGGLRAVTASLVPSLVAHLLWDGLVLLWLPLGTG